MKSAISILIDQFEHLNESIGMRQTSNAECNKCIEENNKIIAKYETQIDEISKAIERLKNG
jgi:prefoldin subunit 5